jgi:(E)-4-hydroxy-3-methylbut-2-enyl-diphosphate synthase
MNRRKSREIAIGNVKIGGNNPIAIQSMLNIPPEKIKENIESAKKLKEAGCDIIRIAIPDKNAIPLITALKENVDMPVVADIHFDYKLALESINAGVDKIRINPGNIGDDSKVKIVVDEAKKKDIPIRIGVNSGSLEKNILKKYGRVTADGLVDSALYHISLLEKFDFHSIAVSIKASNVEMSRSAYRKIAEKTDYPLHLGITEAGGEYMGLIKSSIGIGSLLLDGIGDTIRVSLTADPIKEIDAAKGILKALGLGKKGINFVACPTCGRTRIDVISLLKRAEEELKDVDKDITVAIMGCAVNGPGEAREADIGIAGGNGEGLIIKKGEIVKKVKEEDLLKELKSEIEKM